MAGGAEIEGTIFRGIKYFLRLPRAVSKLDGPAAEEAAALAERDLAEGHKILAALQHAGTDGEEAEAVLREHQVKIVFNRGEGTYYHSHFDTLYVDLEEEGHPAVAIIHETEHIASEKEGRNAFARVTTLGRGDYIEEQIAEEADALTKETRGNIALQRHDPSVPDAPFQDEYLEGGREKILQMLRDGDVIEPESGLTYPEHFGGEWDVKNLEEQIRKSQE